MSKINPGRFLIDEFSQAKKPLKAVFIGENAFSLGKDISKALSNLQASVFIDNAADWERASTQYIPPNLHLILKTELSGIEESIDVVVIVCNSYDAKQTLTKRFEDAARHLEAGGMLYVITHTRIGANTHFKIIESIFLNVMIVARGQGGKRIFKAERGNKVMISDTSDRQIIEETILGTGFKFETRPEVFSKDQIDTGSLSLLKFLPKFSNCRVLDLGCGYGLLGIVLAKLYPDTRITLVDYDLVSVELAKKNVILNAVGDNTEIYLSDGLANIPPRVFDFIVSHLPLHIPRQDLVRILNEARNLLSPNGLLYAVALSNYKLTDLLENIFKQVSYVYTPAEVNASRYTLITARR